MCSHPKFLAQSFSPKVSHPKFLTESFSPKVSRRKFLAEGFSPKVSHRRFLTESFSPKVLAEGFSPKVSHLTFSYESPYFRFGISLGFASGMACHEGSSSHSLLMSIQFGFDAIMSFIFFSRYTHLISFSCLLAVRERKSTS